jgi:hypothetical protein
MRASGVVRAKLEIQRRDIKLLRKLPQGLLRCDPLSGLEAAEVGVRESGLGQIALREAALLAQPPNTPADALGPSCTHCASVDVEHVGRCSRRGAPA